MRTSAQRRARFCTLILAFSLWFAAAAEAGAAEIRWRAAEGAVAYRVEIIDENGREIFRRDTTELSVDVPLQPGNYRLRVTGINKFRQIDTHGNWRPLSILRKAEPETVPEFTRFKPDRFGTKGGGSLELYGKSFPKDIRVEIEDAKGRRTPLPSYWENDARARAELPKETFPDGKYAVVLIAPDGQEYRKEGLTIGDREKGPLYVGAGGGFFRTSSSWKNYTFSGAVFAGYELPLNFAVELGVTMLNAMNYYSDSALLMGDASVSCAPAPASFRIKPVFAGTLGRALNQDWGSPRVSLGFSLSLRAEISRSVFIDLGYTYHSFSGYGDLKMEGILARMSMRL